MAPKKDASAAPETAITGYDSKETKLLAAAFVSSIGQDKYDFALMAKLTGFTEGTTKKFWPPVKRKVMEEHPELAKYLSGTASTTATAATATKAAGKKRKAVDAELDPKVSDAADGNGTNGKPKKAPAKGKRGKKINTDGAETENSAEGGYGKKIKSEDTEEAENSADGGDGMGEFVIRANVLNWLDKTDGPVAEEEV
ncbi:hypothetical protein G6514_004422 [Epicoccum nigrum]|nr:hypothetical protein G6514_004422 [Epicoccum nigrum]